MSRAHRDEVVDVDAAPSLKFVSARLTLVTSARACRPASEKYQLPTTPRTLHSHITQGTSPHPRRPQYSSPNIKKGQWSSEELPTLLCGCRAPPWHQCSTHQAPYDGQPADNWAVEALYRVNQYALYLQHPRDQQSGLYRQHPPLLHNPHPHPQTLPRPPQNRRPPSPNHHQKHLATSPP